jgi:hypothetical protein
MNGQRRALLVELEKVVSMSWDNTFHDEVGNYQDPKARPLWLHDMRVGRTLDRIPDKDLQSLAYKFGFARVGIMRALDKVVDHLVARHGLKME